MPDFRVSSRSALVAALALATSCMSGDLAPGSPTGPVTLVLKGPAAAIVLSTDSVVATAVSGAPRFTRDIDVTAGNAVAVAGLTIASLSVGPGQPPNWVGARLSADVAPATLTVAVNPTGLAPGSYDARVRLVAAGAEPKTVGVSLIVQPRPRSTLEYSANVSSARATHPATGTPRSVGRRAQ